MCKQIYVYSWERIKEKSAWKEASLTICRWLWRLPPLSSFYEIFLKQQRDKKWKTFVSLSPLHIFTFFVYIHITNASIPNHRNLTVWNLQLYVDTKRNKNWRWNVLKILFFTEKHCPFPFNPTRIMMIATYSFVTTTNYYYHELL